MGVMPVRRLLITMSLPMMISMLVQALYNVVDSMFVSYISEYALTAVGLAFPAQNFGGRSKGRTFQVLEHTVQRHGQKNE